MTIEDHLTEILERLDHIEANQDRLGAPVAVAAYNLTDTARVLGVSLPLVRKLIADGHLIAAVYPGMTDRRIPRTSIDALLAASLVHPTPELRSVS